MLMYIILLLQILFIYCDLSIYRSEFLGYWHLARVASFLNWSVYLSF